MFKISYLLLLLSSVSSAICMNGGLRGSVNLNSNDPNSANSSFIDGQTYLSTPHFRRSVPLLELPGVVPDNRNDDVIYMLVGCLYFSFWNDARGLFPYNPFYFNNIPLVYPHAYFKGNAPYNPFYFYNIPPVYPHAYFKGNAPYNPFYFYNIPPVYPHAYFRGNAPYNPSYFYNIHADSYAFSKEYNSLEGESFSDETGGVSSDNFRCQSAPLPEKDNTAPLPEKDNTAPLPEKYNTAYRRREGSCPPVFFFNESTRYEDSAAAGDYVKGDGPLIEKEPLILNKSEPALKENLVQEAKSEASLSIDSDIKDDHSISAQYVNKFNISNTLKSFIASSADYSKKVCKFLEILDKTSLFADVDFASYLADGDLDGSNVFELLNKLSSVIGSKFKVLSVSNFYDGDLDLEFLFERAHEFFKVLHEELCPNNPEKKRLKKTHGTLFYRNLFVQLFHDLIADVFDKRISGEHIDSITNGFFCILEICANGPNMAFKHFLLKNNDGLSHEGIDFIKSININKKSLFKKSIEDYKTWKADCGNNQDRVFLNFAYKKKDGKLEQVEYFVEKVYQALFHKMLGERECFFSYYYEDDIRYALSIAINFYENKPFTLEDLTCTVFEKTVFPVEYVVLFGGADKDYIDQNYKGRHPLIGRIERDDKAGLIKYMKPVDSNMIFYITCNCHIFWNMRLLSYLEREQFSISVSEAMTLNREYIDNIFSKGQ